MVKLMKKKLITKLNEKELACISKKRLAISLSKPLLMKLELSKKANSKFTG